MLAVTGSEDEFAPPDLVEKLVLNLNNMAVVKVIVGANHFLFGFEDELAEVLNRYI
ncbi:MAG: hypothetical protein KKC46_08015 [Proteobacteria bacterium]|nr:hypothetical protein [Pseudomonadota bacterium]